MTIVANSLALGFVCEPDFPRWGEEERGTQRKTQHRNTRKCGTCPLATCPLKSAQIYFRKVRTWAIAVRRGSYKSLSILNSGRFSLEKKVNSVLKLGSLEAL